MSHRTQVLGAALRDLGQSENFRCTASQLCGEKLCDRQCWRKRQLKSYQGFNWLLALREPEKTSKERLVPVVDACDRLFPAPR